ncbi:hypothetical protein PENTCL1PPCAC_20142, partial [Pristionchus entomophagus]
GAADESGKVPSREPTAGAEDETQTTATTAGTAAKTAIASPPEGEGSGSGKGSGRVGVISPAMGSAPAAAPGGGVDSSRRGVGEAAAPAAASAAGTVEKARAPTSAPRLINTSRSRKRRTKRMKKEAVAHAAAVCGTIEDTNGQNTDAGGKYNNDDAYPAEREACRWKQLEMFRRANLFQRFPVESSPEQLVADLAYTYVKTIELTMEKRYRSISRKCWLTALLSLLTIMPIFVFMYHRYNQQANLHILNDWVQGKNWPLFLYPLVIHLLTWPLCTIPLVFCTGRFRVYNAAANLFMVPLFAIFIATGLILHLPTHDGFSAIIEDFIDYVMRTARHLEDASTEESRQNVANNFMHLAMWAGAQSLVCCLTFRMSMRTLTALRYYNKYTFEADHPAQTVEYAEKCALVGQATKRVPLTNYKNIADSHARTPRTPGSKSAPNSPAPATAI